MDDKSGILKIPLPTIDDGFFPAGFECLKRGGKDSLGVITFV